MGQSRVRLRTRILFEEREAAARACDVPAFSRSIRALQRVMPTPSIMAVANPALKLPRSRQNSATNWLTEPMHLEETALQYARVPANCYQKSAKIGRSGVRQAFNPVQRAKDVGIAPEIIFARGNTENVAAALVSDGTPDTLRKKRELVLRRLFARSTGSPFNLRSAFASQPLFIFRPSVRSGPSFNSNPSVSIEFRFIIAHDISRPLLNMS